MTGLGKIRALGALVLLSSPLPARGQTSPAAAAPPSAAPPASAPSPAASTSVTSLASPASPASPAPAPQDLDAASAERYARLALACVDREYPNKPEHVLDGPADARPPRSFHPAFFGCYDWHSSVHGHWMLVRLLVVRPDLPSNAKIRTILADHFSAASIASEVAYMDRKSARSFERTYGWAWVLRLALELERGGPRDPDLAAWRERLRPLENAIVSRFTDYLPKLTNPVRTGVHPNTAFALAEALDYAHATGRVEFEKAVATRSREFFAADRACPLSYEPSGEDFFSPCLEEADLMRRVLAPATFAEWLAGFLPGLSPGSGGDTFPLTPAVVTDPTDPKLVHLDGLNLSRAWALDGIARSLPASDPRRPRLLRAAREHARAGLARVSSGSYEGEHWLASFAIRLTADAGP